MAKVMLRKTNSAKRKLRVRKKVFGTGSKPRFSVFKSGKHIYGQLIDDSSGKTLVSTSDLEDVKGLKGKTKTEKAFEVGKALAKKALAKKLKVVVFDKSSYRYHGRVKSLADGAREGGLVF